MSQLITAWPNCTMHVICVHRIKNVLLLMVIASMEGYILYDTRVTRTRKRSHGRCSMDAADTLCYSEQSNHNAIHIVESI